MNDLIMGYVLDALSPEETADMAQRLERTPALREQVERLRRDMAALRAAETYPAPPGLAERTLDHVAAMTAPSTPAPFRWSPAKMRWTELLVAAAVSFLLIGFGALAISRVRHSANSIAICQNNLRGMFFALRNYYEVNRHMPNVADERPRDVAGMVLPMLRDSGYAVDPHALRCPGGNHTPICDDPLNVLRAMSTDEFNQRAPQLLVSYAYSLGFRDSYGTVKLHDLDMNLNSASLPILADRPPSEDFSNSTHHGGRGQNVLFLDGHVTFLSSRLFNADDMFVNRDFRAAAGVDALDVVLGVSSARP